MPRVGRLMRAGRLSFSKVRELTRLVGRVVNFRRHHTAGHEGGTTLTRLRRSSG